MMEHIKIGCGSNVDVVDWYVMAYEETYSDLNLSFK